MRKAAPPCPLSNILNRVTSAVAVAIVTCTGCGDRTHSPPAPVTPVEVSFTGPISLHDGPARILARPLVLSTGASGEIIVGDRSDKDIKVYSPSGARLRTVGRPGEGPGEFMSLTGAQSYGDSLAAYDFLLRRLTVFSPDGKEARAITLTPPAFSMRVLDDSLFLLTRHPGQAGYLLRVIRRDGSTVAEFFDARHTFRDATLRQLSAVFADGVDGRIFAGVFGKDSIFVFDYHGRQIARGRITGSAEMESLPDAYARAGRRQQLADGRWFHDGINALVSLVALRNGRAALLVARYDTEVGTDVLEGGELIVLEPRSGQLVGLARQHVQAGLLGRDREGAAMFLRYSNTDSEGIDLVRATLR